MEITEALYNDDKVKAQEVFNKIPTIEEKDLVLSELESLKKKLTDFNENNKLNKKETNETNT